MNDSHGVYNAWIIWRICVCNALSSPNFEKINLCLMHKAFQNTRRKYTKRLECMPRNTLHLNRVESGRVTKNHTALPVCRVSSTTVKNQLALGFFTKKLSQKPSIINESTIQMPMYLKNVLSLFFMGYTWFVCGAWTAHHFPIVSQNCLSA